MKKSHLVGVVGVVVAIGAVAWIWHATIKDKKNAGWEQAQGLQHRQNVGSEQEQSVQHKAEQLLAQAAVYNSIPEMLAQCEFSVEAGPADALASWPLVRTIAIEWRPTAACYEIRSAARVYNEGGATVLGWMYVFSNSEDHESLVVMVAGEGVSAVATVPDGFGFLGRAPFEEIAVELHSENAVVLGVEMSDTTLGIIADYTERMVGSGYPIKWRPEYTYTYIDAVSGESVDDQLSDSARSLITGCIHAPETARGMPELDSDYAENVQFVFFEYGSVVRAFYADWLRKDSDTAKSAR